ncbi:YdcF family protein [Ruminococcus sp.]|uniref:YdcF family protein n=1 Tax=Ruminococcus sp. TaxID=41978 RepID=UPI0025D36671|nr:YdcF family protein [Ruminococcus sp.]MBQ8967955.1 YdcF family protein [Ruminococcus sp.]
MTIRYVILAVEIFILLLFVMTLPIVNEGNTAGMLFMGLVIAATIKFEPFCRLLKKLWGKVPGKILITGAALFLAVGFTYVGILSYKMYSAQENAPTDTKLIVVLGCQVRGERPSRMLRRRLDVAYKAMEKHPEAVCVVSGGQGNGEKISEAEAMKKYLVDKGADESRIIMEDRSTSTFENIKFTFEITDKLGYGRDITIVTDGFHQYRASLIAKQEGAGEITAYSAYTEPRYLFTFWVREWLGLTHFWVFGN